MLSKLDKRVLFQKPKRVSNGRGGYVLDEENPEAIGTYWAGIKVKSRALTTLYKGERLESNVFITIRDNAEIVSGCQAVYKDVTYKITEDTPSEKAPGYTILAAYEAVK